MTFFLVVHVLICVFLVAVILVQPGKGDAGIGFGSSSQSIFGSKGAGNFLTKTTSVCAVVFLLTSFFLTRSRMREYNSSVIKAGAAAEPAMPVAVPAPVPGADKADPTKAGAPPAGGAEKVAVPAAKAVPVVPAAKAGK